VKGIALIAVIAAIGLWLFKMMGGTRARVLIRVEGGRTWVTKGKLSGRLLREISEVVKDTPKSKGTIALEGPSGQPEVVVEGLPKDIAQRVRNVVANHGR